MPIPAPAPTPAQLRETADPTERSQPIPLLVAGITLAMVLAGAGYILFSEPFGMPGLGDRRTLADLRPGAGAAGAVDGKQVFAANCVACHQAAGTGVPGVFPPLDGSEWVQGEPRVLANILLHGVEGELTVKGHPYKGSMPSFARLGDAELAAVASYIRTSWGNQAGAVPAELFTGERKQNPREKPFGGGAELGALAARSP
ncbi:c-type cytochrome [Ramlibacter alkalitolerans]|uniref:Cytochrome c n=1 Tax=Ramlibacter alkalitolerans TaxID=2039631 RepID=A0ABS1JLZ0_9BURK|nr:cytochrome c [Ramlibacter alkalitolerans]MBL0425201.1 cytochrome c [Ramlibacter alkalitolerans]